VLEGLLALYMFIYAVVEAAQLIVVRLRYTPPSWVHKHGLGYEPKETDSRLVRMHRMGGDGEACTCLYR
jgi:hypothetical protein